MLSSAELRGDIQATTVSGTDEKVSQALGLQEAMADEEADA